MAEIKENNAKFLQGIREVLSGSFENMTFRKDGRINLKDESPHVKRPTNTKKNA
ncbi:MAG: hypothetical protein HC912_04140 [Saprospiraceae bacterium]|nr:hypothetical protein [Saprospiraceae bacterium]